MISLDRIVTTPLDARVRMAMEPFLAEHWGHPSSPGSSGDAPSAAIEEARRHVAALVGAVGAGDVFFTSSGTESLNWALKGVLAHPKARGRHLVLSSIEALPLRHSAERLLRQGAEITWLPVDSRGLVSPEDVQASLRRDTALVALTAASGEIGTLEPLAEIGALAGRSGIPFLVDATQAAGWTPLDAEAARASLMALSAHYFLGPKGTGALYRREGTPLAPLVEGGAQEQGLRAGTQNVAGIAGMGEAARLARQEMTVRRERLQSLASLVRRALSGMDGAVFTGHPAERLPGHVSFCMEGLDGEALLARLNAAGVSAASGSACASETGKPSHVLKAMGLSASLTKGSLVLAPQLYCTMEDVSRAMDLLAESAAALRAASG
jgi:cysteine desulfurase